MKSQIEVILEQILEEFEDLETYKIGNYFQAVEDLETYEIGNYFQAVEDCENIIKDYLKRIKTN